MVDGESQIQGRYRAPSPEPGIAGPLRAARVRDGEGREMRQ